MSEGLKAYYFKVEVYRRCKLQTVIELATFKKLVDFFNAITQFIVATHGECTVIVSKAYVSMPATHDVRIVEFSCENQQEVVKKAMEV